MRLIRGAHRPQHPQRCQRCEPSSVVTPKAAVPMPSSSRPNSTGAKAWSHARAGTIAEALAGTVARRAEQHQRQCPLGDGQDAIARSVQHGKHRCGRPAHHHQQRCAHRVGGRRHLR